MTMRIYLHKPKVVLRARLDMQGQQAIYPQEVIVFDNVTVGSYTELREGMTVLIGSAAGLMDYGRVRFRYMDDDVSNRVMRVARYSEGTRDGEARQIDNAYITVLEEYLIWAKIPQFFGGAIWKDTDLAPSGLNGNPPPMANGGPGVAGTIDSVTGRLEVAFSASGSFIFDIAYSPPVAAVTNFVWDIPDGSTVVGGGIAQASITLRFLPGFYYVYLIAQKSDGSTSHVKKIPVFARDPANDLSTTQFHILSQVQTQIGQEIKIQLFSPLPRDQYYDGFLMMLWDEDYIYDPTNRWHMQFIGWHQADEITIQPQETATFSDTHLTFLDAGKKLELLPGFPQVQKYESVNFLSWTTTRFGVMLYYFWYLLYYHSTVLDVADFIADTNTLALYKFVIIGSDRQNLSAQINDLAAKVSPDHRMVCSKQGELRFIVDLNIQKVADRTAVVADHYSENEWTSISYNYTNQPRIGQIRTKALISSNTFIIVNGLEEIEIISCVAPGEGYGQGEQYIQAGERIVFNQADLNAVEGNRYAKMNARFAPFTITVPIEKTSRYIDLADVAWVTLTFGSVDYPIREIVGSFTTVRGIITEISTAYEYSDTGLARTLTYKWEMETSGRPAQTVILWPDSPSEEDLIALASNIERSHE